MSTPIPSPSMNGMVGLSGVGWPGTILAPPAATSMCVVALILTYRVLVRTKATQAIAAVPRDAAREIVTVLIEGFDKHYRLFRATSARAKEQFEAGAWTELQHAVQERIRFYDRHVRECVDRLRDELNPATLGDETWGEAKLHFIGLLVEHSQPELAETFFNSVVSRALQRTYYDNDLIFVRAAISTEYIESDPPIYRSYYPNLDGERECFAPRRARS
jgi:isocitrate dehydrogenase kinase/phosphatase